jgi:hypothetical protein
MKNLGHRERTFARDLDDVRLQARLHHPTAMAALIACRATGGSGQTADDQVERELG